MSTVLHIAVSFSLGSCGGNLRSEQEHQEVLFLVGIRPLQYLRNVNCEPTTAKIRP